MPYRVVRSGVVDRNGVTWFEVVQTGSCVVEKDFKRVCGRSVGLESALIVVEYAGDYAIQLESISQHLFKYSSETRGNCNWPKVDRFVVGFPRFGDGRDVC